MLDIRFVRENPDAVRTSQRRRHDSDEVVDEVLKYDNMWKEALKRINDFRAVRNKKSREIGQIKKEGGDISGISGEMKEISAEIKELEKGDPSLSKYRQLMSKLPEYNGNIIFPLFRICEDSIKVGFVVKSDRDIQFYTPVYEGEKYIIDFSRRSQSGKKFLIF